ncbi:hypothetical protein GTP46_24290 [Duganella sp. FT135W]|uniref:Uncharacterized protein n=1 Tax=Duganella flavida TaxID=2692175 RepID=A0A6L8KJ36_9BURK|nr:hypothetical protein [Duganella flavida]MYM25752.1 hypothetical protein [Duganella flavida]
MNRWLKLILRAYLGWRAIRAYKHAGQRCRNLYEQHRALGIELTRALRAERVAGERMEEVLKTNS